MANKISNLWEDLTSNKYRRRKVIQKIIIHILIVLAVLVLMTPLLWAIIASTQTPGQIYQYPPRLIPGNAFVRNFSIAWSRYNVGRGMLNSFIIAAIISFVKIILALTSAMALVYYEFPMKSWIFFFILLTLLMPVPVRIVPLFDIVNDLGWANSYWALTVPFFASATGTFLFRQHFMSIPTSIAEAARVDGIGPFRFLFQILTPMSKNTIGAFIVITFVYVWNQYLWPMLIITTRSRQVVQLSMQQLTTSGPEQIVDWGVAMAGALTALIPPLIIFFLLQEQFMKGFALSDEK